jgi:hypothetical protein
MRNSGKQLVHYKLSFLLFKELILHDKVVQITSTTIFHYEMNVAFVLVDFEEFHYVGMVQRLQDFQLTTQHVGFLAHARFLDSFYGEFACLLFAGLSLTNGAEGAVAEHFADFIEVANVVGGGGLLHLGRLADGCFLVVTDTILFLGGSGVKNVGTFFVGDLKD